MNKVIIANWKSYISTAKEATMLLKRIIPYTRRQSVVICPSIEHLSLLSNLTKSKKISFGAQDISIYTQGGHTGEVIIDSLVDLGASYVIVGHSDRRVSEDFEIIKTKFRSIISAGATAVLCVGETNRDTSFDEVKEQILSLIEDIAKSPSHRVVIAYEPVWAIGKDASEAPEPKDIYVMSTYIKSVIASNCGVAATKKIRILYGGSVKPSNVAAIVKEGSVDGVLVGSASVEADSFIEIMRLV